MPNGITSIEFENTNSPSPARTNRDTGQVWLNSRFLGVLPASYWDFIIDHEEGHIVGNNRSEITADEHASAKFFRKYPSRPFDSVAALKNVLPMTTQEQKLRVQLQTERAAKFDCNYNRNSSSCEMIAEKKNIEAPANNTHVKPAEFLAMLYIGRYFKASAESHFVEGGCKPGQYACIAAETKRKQAEMALQAAQEQTDALKYVSELEYKKGVATILGMTALQEGENKIAEMQAALEREKLKSTAVNSTKLTQIALIAGAALAVVLVLFMFNDES